MEIPKESKRRAVLKTIGAGVVGSIAFTGSASAGDWNDERRQDTFTWGQTNLWEMLASEGPGDDEGDENAHRPIWLIDSMDGTEVAGSEHSPHFGGVVDHVVPIEGTEFTAQWHIHAVVNADKPFIDTDGDGKGDFPNFENQAADGTYLISADRINNANGIKIIESEHVFTCPVRPHNHHP